MSGNHDGGTCGPACEVNHEHKQGGNALTSQVSAARASGSAPMSEARMRTALVLLECQRAGHPPDHVVSTVGEGPTEAYCRCCEVRWVKSATPDPLTETFEEWRVSGRPTHPHRSSEITFGNQPGRLSGAILDPEARARRFIEFAARYQPWADGPHLHRRTVTITAWEPR